MAAAEMKGEDVEKLGSLVGLNLKPGNSKTIASMLTEIRKSVYLKGAVLKQDAPLSLYFDARWGVGGNG